MSSLVREIKQEIRAAQQIRLPGWLLVCLFVASFICFLQLDRIERSNLVVPLLNAILVLGLTIVFKRRIWGEVWFWTTMAVITAVHGLVIVFVPWTTRWTPALVVAGFASLDFVLVLWVFAIIGRLLGKPNELQLEKEDEED